MHEVSVAAALLEAVLEGAGDLGPDARISEIHLEIGPMAGISVPALTFAFEVAVRGTIAEGADLVIQLDPVIVRCASCGAVTEYETLAFDCGSCGALSPDVTADNRLELVRLVTLDPCN